MFYYFLSLVVCTFPRWWRGNYPQLPHALAPKMPVFIGVSACAPAADCAPGSVERARPVAAILSAVAVERHAGAVGMGARSNVTPSPPGKIVTPSPLASRARERHAVAAFILARVRSRSSSRRGRRRVDRHAVAAFILSTVPGPCSSWRGRREDREAVAVVYGHAARRVLALSRVRPVICRRHGWQSARRKKQGGLGARINTGLPVVLARRRRQWCAGFHARVPCPWGQCGVPRLLAASIIGARVNSSE